MTKHIDRILLNLKIISKLETGIKLSRHGSQLGTLELDRQDSYFSKVKRWIRNDNRHASIDDLKLIVSEAIESNEPLIIREYPFVISGLEHLKETYKEDAMIVSELDILIQKLREN